MVTRGPYVIGIGSVEVIEREEDLIVFNIKALAVASALTVGTAFAMPVASQAMPVAPVKIQTAQDGNIVKADNRKKWRRDGKRWRGDNRRWRGDGRRWRGDGRRWREARHWRGDRWRGHRNWQRRYYEPYYDPYYYGGYYGPGYGYYGPGYWGPGIGLQFRID